MNLKDLIENKKAKERLERTEVQRLRILELIEKNPLITNSEITEATGFSSVVVRNRIEDMRDSGIIVLERRRIIVSKLMNR